MADGLTAIDWRAPWFEPWREPGERLALRHLAGLPVHEVLNQEAAAPVRFAPQDRLPAGDAYEQHIFRTGECPTRDNLHDFFNGLCWLRYPQAKTRLNQLQAEGIEAAGPAGARGPVRDAITVFDENGALLDAPPALFEALRQREWRLAFVELRPLWAETRLLLFGHALLEKLARPRKAITAHVWNEPVQGASAEAVDGWLAGRLATRSLAAKPFLPLPVLGVPGWSASNENFSFYDDSVVFRPARRER